MATPPNEEASLTKQIWVSPRQPASKGPVGCFYARRPAMSFRAEFHLIGNCARLGVMRWPVILLLFVSLMPVPASAQAAQRGCFTKAEESAEQIVREGLRLREGARGCDAPPWSMHTQALWDDVDQRFGPRFAAQTRVRRNAFQREFSDDADNRLEMWNARIVYHFRNYPLSEVYCAGITDMLQQVQKKGWGALLRNASKGADEVKMDYRLCGQ